jgi:hypothetical protein
MTVTVLVTGGRDYKDREHVFQQLDWLAERYGDLKVIEGGADGADKWARAWRADRRRPGRSYIANWARYPRGAGVLRNAEMLADGKPDLVLAFPGGRGTADMIRRAQTAGVRVIEIAARVQ